MAKRKFAATQLQCPECDNIQTIQRRQSKMREKNHIKHMYCWKCKETTGHIEVKEDIFLPEWLREEQA